MKKRNQPDTPETTDKTKKQRTEDLYDFVDNIEGLTTSIIAKKSVSYFKAVIRDTGTKKDHIL